MNLFRKNSPQEQYKVPEEPLDVSELVKDGLIGVFHVDSTLEESLTKEGKFIDPDKYFEHIKNSKQLKPAKPTRLTVKQLVEKFKNIFFEYSE